MKIIANEKLIKRNNKIGNILSIASVVILGVGMFYSFQDKDGSYMTLTFSALIVGFILFQISSYYVNRFGKPPRPDQKLSQALKGLDDKYALYHYMGGVSHLLVSPVGIYILLPYNQVGSISYNSEKKRWKQTGGNFFLKTFGGESLGRPDLDANYAINDLNRFCTKKGIDLADTTPEPIVVFINDKATVNTEGYEGLAVTAAKLKETIRRNAKTKSIPQHLISEFQQILEPK